MSRYIFGRNRANWNDPSSKYGLEPSKFDEDVTKNIERRKTKKAKINGMLDGLMREDPARQEETFEMILDWAREWRILNDRD